MQEVAVLPFFLQIPKIKWVEFQNSTHLAQFEEPERLVVFFLILTLVSGVLNESMTRYFQVILEFLLNTEEGLGT